MRTKTIYKVSEIAHLFVHQKVEYAKSNNHRFEIKGKDFYDYGELVAQIWNKKLYVSPFTTKSAWGGSSGFNNYNITKAAHNVLKVINLPVKFWDLDLITNRQTLINDITLYYANEQATIYARFHNMIYGTAKKASESYIRSGFNDYKKLLRVLKVKPTQDILDRIIECSVRLYKGWGINNYTIYKAPDKTVKWLLEGKFLNAKETVIYEDKLFYSSYIYGSGISFEESRIRFNTKEKQDEYKAGKEDREYDARKHKEEKLKVENKEAYDKAIKQLYDWAEGRSNHKPNNYIHNEKFRNRSRLICLKLPVVLCMIGGVRYKDENRGIVCDSDAEYIIETSLGVRFPLDDGKKLYQLYKVCRAKEKLWKANGKQFDIGGYKLSMIGKRDGKWFIIAGCHEVFEDEIERFINFNKLDW